MFFRVFVFQVTLGVWSLGFRPMPYFLSITYYHAAVKKVYER
jgi:hypothetical protein